MKRTAKRLFSLAVFTAYYFSISFGSEPLYRHYTNDNEGQIRVVLQNVVKSRRCNLGFLAVDGFPFGHATVLFNSLGLSIDPDFDGKCIGYHPVNSDPVSLARMVRKRPVPGSLKTDFNEEVPTPGFLPQILKYPRVYLLVDEMGYQAALLAAKNWQEAHPDYVVGVSDCVSFLAHVAKAAGLRVPNRNDGNMTPSVFMAELLAWNLEQAESAYFVRQVTAR
ncbi:MAG: hypothetical protein WA771_07765 [Chthoniobacterales bacterium]